MTSLPGTFTHPYKLKAYDILRTIKGWNRQWGSGKEIVQGQIGPNLEQLDPVEGLVPAMAEKLELNDF